MTLSCVVILGDSNSTCQQIVVFTDGALKGNPGPDGWGAIIAGPDGHVTDLGGSARLTTNSQMELTGAIAALSALEPTSP